MGPWLADGSGRLITRPYGALTGTLTSVTVPRPLCSNREVKALTVQLQSKVSRIVRLGGLTAVAAAIGLGTGCAKKLDRITIDKVIATGVHHDDIDRVCATGEGLGIALGSLTKKSPLKAMVMADVSAALCLEADVRRAQLDGAFARYHFEGEQKLAGVLDARYREERAHTAAAYRYKRAWDQLEEAYGPVGADACPNIKEKDEIVYLMGLYAGIHGMLHDQAGGGKVGISFDTLGKVARGTACLDNERWWQVPDAFKWAAYATLDNREDGDPWEELAKTATAGDATGIRLARAVHVMIAGNADRTDDLTAALTAHATSRDEVPADPAWIAMDRYAFDVSRHESDRLWMATKGHRTPTFGDLPFEEAVEDGGGTNPFGGDDPFGGDPFGGGGSDAAPAEDDSAPDGGSDDDASDSAEETP